MLTPTEITRAIKNATAETILNDTTEGRGAGALKLRIRPTADGVTATWVVAWKQGGQRAFKPLGRYPDMTLAQAREAYRTEVAPVLMAGKDPRVTVAAAGKPTVARMFQGYVDSLKAKGRASAVEVERMLLQAKDNAASALGRDRLAGTVDASDVVAYVSGFYRRGHRGAADKARSYVSSAYNWAIKATHDYTNPHRQDWGVKANPAASVQRDAEATTARERALSASELRTLWQAAEPGHNGFTLETAACIRLLIATGQRVTAALRLEGCELDLVAGTWTMPKHKTKLRKRPHVIPLPAVVLPILSDLVGLHGTGPLFPSRSDAEGPFMDHRSIMQAIDRWLALPDVDVAPFQTRDIRRTWKSRTGEIGISREMRDLIQQHAKHDTGSKHYDRADYLPQMREAMDRWNVWLADNVAADERQREAVAA